MKTYFIPLLILATVCLGCGKNKVYKSWIQTYTMNAAYNGAHRTDMTATYYINESASDLKVEVNLLNVEPDLADEYIISMHLAAPGTALGFEKQPTYNIGKTTKLTIGAVAILVTAQEFDSIKNFDGYLVIQDPNQIGIDSLAQLLFVQKLN